MKEEILQKIKDDSKKENISTFEAYTKNREKIKINETNEIYFYEVSLDEELRKECKLYFNLESGHARWINLEDCEEFEHNHIIVTGPEFSFGSIQREFISEAVKTNQKDAVKKIVKKYKK